MAIITKNTVARGTPAQFTLSKFDLANHAKVLADAHFSNMANWKYVSAAYTSTTSGQSETLVFDMAEVSPSTFFSISERSVGSFSVQDVTIHDLDGGFLIITRVDLASEVANFDVIFDSNLDALLAEDGSVMQFESGDTITLDL